MIVAVALGLLAGTGYAATIPTPQAELVVQPNMRFGVTCADGVELHVETDDQSRAYGFCEPLGAKGDDSTDGN